MSTAIFLLLILFSNTGLAVEIEHLLATQISEAKCAAQCGSVVNDDHRSQCLEICLVVQDDESSYICTFKKLCRGGCRVACDGGEEDVKQERRLLNVVQKSCRISWELNNCDGTRFLVVGRDQGDMWNLVANKIKEKSIDLNQDDLGRYKHVRIFAITRTKIVDQATINVQPK